LTGTKGETKVYRRHTGYPGGVRVRRAGPELIAHPERMLREAVVGMLPKNRLGRQLATQLKIYRGSEHPHVAQQPVAVAAQGELTQEPKLPPSARGNRKSAVPGVHLMPGNAETTINRRPVEAYFGRPTSRMIILQPFEVSGTAGQFDVAANVAGGGVSAQ